MAKKSNLYYKSKIITLLIPIIILLIGIAGCFISNFNMEKFISFLPTFAPFYIAFIGVLGAGGAYKNHLSGSI